ncbi:2-succinyl-6-hydroxy-2,4-cyclohexadiene-1-carboxylate synthase [Ectothiorhodospira lacustris]|uniref:2-succinyl-6-hydroxy-2, 4-cyclohexadiene-1-carboxylate synthase n=1 Tax=Ectothiorhodospira lacustris TaxID=2899127 RepID=UPI001EE8A944|nr:2-succinyl-6-hydroxy-2,4-cyclohexadiene-1-carboxylate synthase [Ectothiorhodospira lacustris]MCG5499431.1 2-succinyl-6-hydroxy-2,4-cyclohexadiene-1-carboxylate synthase [Ectothiorhodospira lacustris]MCG5511264.1 2-succinyl-6-hydroxy-2,4-cyclohexadiene-1-carboxylate synthase [Ectothiorhodospira lacustris]MCG5522992.1 2-succinyl-6-hydroxy-2,4-cyclohexadiene-1-carboxylate synthase [Ectothiorhodospira lacustris]
MTRQPVIASLGAVHHPTLVLLHGFMGSGHDWLQTARLLSDRYHCLMPDLPGHAGQSLSADLNFEEYCERLWQQLAPALPPHVGLAGYSMGGRIAAWLAIRHPERIAVLLLEGAHPGLNSETERLARRRHDEAWARRLEQEPWPRVLEDWYQQPVFADLSPAQRDAFVQARSCQNPMTLARVLRAAGLSGQPDLRPGLAGLTCARAFIAGTRDTKFSALGQGLTHACPGLELVKLDGLGHNCHAQAPEQVAAVMRRLCHPMHFTQTSTASS